MNQRCSALKTQFFRAKNNNADSELIFSVTALNFSVLSSADSEKIRADQLFQSCSALMFFVFSESALKNVKTLKQRCSELIISVTSTRDTLFNIVFSMKHSIYYLIQLYFVQYKLGDT